MHFYAHFLVWHLLVFSKPIFIKGLVSSTHIRQGIFSSWNKKKLCSPGATKIFVIVTIVG